MAKGADTKAAAAADPEQLYLSAKQRVEAAGAKLEDEQFTKVSADLRRVAEEANDPHLRANASLLLGALLEERGDRKAAISYYRQARAQVPEEASTHAMLALALAAEQQFDEAAQIQSEVVKLLPDDLEAWLLLGEMNLKAGNEKAGKDAYARYEIRRKGLLDGLTLEKDGEYLVSAEDRAGCAAALEPAADTGTALALLYALQSDPDGIVRAEIARVMGAQRLEGYKKGLEEQLEKETEPDVREAIMWAVKEISRDPVETRPGESPVGQPTPDEAPKAPAEGERPAEESGAAEAG